MHKKKSKLRERTQLTFIYSLMILTIVSILAILVLVIQGYRYNRFDGKIEQGGLVQFDSRPAGATVSVDGINLGNKTASKITLTSGEHTISMVREGYNEWTKTVTVKPGTILWLNYTLLFPTSQVVSATNEFTTVSSAIGSPNHNWMAVVATPAEPTIQVVRLDSDTSTTTKVTIPATNYTAAVDPVLQRFSVDSWDKDSQKVLVRHDFDGKHEYIVVGVRDNSDIYNVTTQLGVDVTKVAYSRGDSNILYMLTATGELRRATISSSTLSGPLATNVSDFSTADDKLVTYETLADLNGQRSVGYVSGGSNKAKQISSHALGNETPLHVRVGIYYDERYIVISHGSGVDIVRGDLPQSDSKDTISTTSVAQFVLSDGAAFVGFSPDNHRIVYAQSGDKLTTYDLELDKTSTITLPSAPTREVDWIDGYHFAAVVGNSATVYDYDGTNGQSVSTKVSDLPVVLEGNDKYMYYFTSNGATTTLSRLTMKK